MFTTKWDLLMQLESGRFSIDERVPNFILTYRFTMFLRIRI